MLGQMVSHWILGKAALVLLKNDDAPSVDGDPDLRSDCVRICTPGPMVGSKKVPQSK